MPEKVLYQRTKRARRLLLAIGLLVILSITSWFSVKALQLGTLPPEKQVIENIYNQERTQGYQNPATKDPTTAAPGQGPDFQYPTGIIEDGEAPFPAEEVTILNRWQEIENSNLLIVYAGSLTTDSTQGLVIVSYLSSNPAENKSDTYLTPFKAGPVRITSANNLLLRLASVNRTQFGFNVQDRTFQMFWFVPLVKH